MVAERRAPRLRARKLTPTEAAQVANLARLETADWNQLTSAANGSSRHVKSLDRWRQDIRAKNPSLSDAQVDILAERKRSEYYRELARKSAVARAAKASARAADPAA